MKNKIDELFKANASQGHFTYKDAYWADAEKLLGNSPKGGGISSGIIATASFLIIGAAVVLSLISTASTADNNSIEQNAAELSSESIFNEYTKPNTNNTASEPRNGARENTLSNFKNQSITDTKNAENDNLETRPAGTEKTTAPTGQIAAKTASQGENNQSSRNTVQTEKETSSNNTFKTGSKTSSSQANSSIANRAVTGNASETNYNTTALAQNSPQAFANNLLDLNAQEEDVVKSSSAARIEPFKRADNFTFNLGAEFGYYLLNRSLQSPNNDYTSFRTEFEDVNNMTTMGLNLQIGYGNWLLNTGVYQTKINESMQYPTNLMINIGVDNGAWNVDEIWSYAVDSNWVIDSIYTGHWRMDTAWALNYDSTYVDQWDSVKTEKEMPELAKNKGPKTLSYLEIPVWFGRSFGSNKIAFDVQGGFALGFLTQTSGTKYINNNLTGLSELGVEQYNKLLFSVMLRTGIRFEIMPRWEAGLYPSLRYTLNSAVKTEGIKQRYFSYGLNLGLSYRF